MTHSNNDDRYPLSAISLRVFDILQADDELVRRYGLSVNQTVQRTLNGHSPNIVLIRTKAVIERAVRDNNSTHYEAYKSFEYYEGDVVSYSGVAIGSIKRVRVSEGQFDLLRRAQSDLAAYGFRVPASCILTGWMSVLDSRVKDAFMRKEVPIQYLKGARIKWYFQFQALNDVGEVEAITEDNWNWLTQHVDYPTPPGEVGNSSSVPSVENSSESGGNQDSEKENSSNVQSQG